MQNMKSVEVFADDRHVGTLAEYSRGRIAFEYADSWILTGFPINPFSLPLQKKLFIPEGNDFEGLFGVFDDSLPDGWGRLLTDRYLKANGIESSSIRQITRLAMLPDTSMGLLEYKPRIDNENDSVSDDIEALFSTAKAILGETAADVDDIIRLYRKGGSSGGARPKINAIIDGDLWIVKFPSFADGNEAGLREYECNKRAADAGINIADFRLLDSKTTEGFFASRRFDRVNDRRIHMISLSGLLESSHRYPALDYKHLLQVTMILTHSEAEVYEAFRRACFNVLIGNQDDHGKNFAFLYDEDNKQWHLSPAFDLTESRTYYGEHSTTVCGKGRNITCDDLRKLGDEFKLREQERDEIIRDVKAACIR